MFAVEDVRRHGWLRPPAPVVLFMVLLGCNVTLRRVIIDQLIIGPNREKPASGRRPCVLGVDRSVRHSTQKFRLDHSILHGRVGGMMVR